jgi:hypothetical protein
MLGTYRNFIGNNPYRHIESHAKDDCRRKCPGDECCKRLPMMQQMSKAIFYFTEAERSEETNSSTPTLKTLRRFSFLVPLGDILPEALLVFRRNGVLQLCCRFCFTTSQNN